MLDDPFFIAYFCGVAALLGLCMGSFLNCAAARCAAGESVVKGRSHCDSCGHALAVWDLIPLFSWVFLRGKCRYCGASIGVRDLLAELLTGAVYVSAVLRWGISLRTAEMLILASILICIALIDGLCYRIPDGLILAGIGVRAVFLLAEGIAGGNLGALALQAGIGAFSVSLPVFIVVLIMEKILKKEAMGGGDLKLLWMTGLFLGWQNSILALLAACLVGLVFGLITRAGSRRIPFGPFIAAGAWLSLLFGDRLLAAYLGLFGL